MGGVGSGRYCRWSNTTTIEETKRIDIRFMRRKGMLRAGGHGSLTWNRNGEPAGDIRYSCYADRIVFHYRYQSAGNDWESVDPVAYFDRTPCHMGGERLWFICPNCKGRCEVLCLAGIWPACRKCYRLPYRSQNEDLMGRLQRRQEKLEAMLWGDQRKWWRKAKRARLEAEWERVAVAYDETFVLAAAKLLDPIEINRLLGKL
jgi:hypothetical protein